MLPNRPYRIWGERLPKLADNIRPYKLIAKLSRKCH